jgi:hypothetical protein
MHAGVYSGVRFVFLLAWLAVLTPSGGVYAQGGAVQSGFAADVSLSPSQVKAGGPSVLTYSFKVIEGAPTWWRIVLSWVPEGLAVRSIEKNGVALWLMNQSGSPPQSSVASWTVANKELELWTYAGDMSPGDVLKITFAVSVPDTLTVGLLDGWLGQAGKVESLNPCPSAATKLTAER